ncbi:hypothetical protein LDENG_00133710 [Lucifuga dentata]|nr:hypothetical protein LDENG_00133710 [Lucifuga dentata]
MTLKDAVVRWSRDLPHPELAEDSKSQACSTPCNLELWIQVRNRKARAEHSRQQRSSDTLVLSDRLQALSHGDGPRSPVGPQQDDHLSSAWTSAPEPAGGSIGVMDHFPPGFGPTGSPAHTLGCDDHPRCLLSVPPWSGM